jgi:N-acetyl-anhydromuramyl-L-alanine amidase AmpD
MGANSSLKPEKAIQNERQFRKAQKRVIGCVLVACLLTLVGLWRIKAQRRTVVVIPPPVMPVIAKPAYQPQGIVFHHSETPAKVGKVVINALALNRINANDHPNWRTEFEGKVYYIGYHYVILPDGTVEPGRPELCVGTHARKYNNWLGICLVGAFDKRHKGRWWPWEPTQQQRDALVKLTTDLMLKYNIPIENVRRHIDVNQTYCPGEFFPYQAIMTAVRDDLHLRGRY